MGGGGGQAPKCTDIKKNHIHVTYMHERAKRASASETYRPLFSHMIWRYKRQYRIKHWHWENLWINYASERGPSELGNFSHFHILKLLFPSIFCWYFWYFISKTHIFSGLKLHLHIHYNQCSSLLLLMVWRCINDSYVYRQNTNIEKIYVYASERA